MDLGALNKRSAYYGLALNAYGARVRMQSYSRKLSGVPANADELDSAMSDVVHQLQVAHDAGLQSLGGSNGSGFLNWLTGSSETENTISANYTALQDQIDKLNVSLRQAVLTGQNESGGAYDINKWKSFATVVGNSIKAQTGYAWDSSGLNVLKETYAATADQVTNPFAWPWWLWGIVGVGGLIVLHPVLSLAASALKARGGKPSASAV